MMFFRSLVSWLGGFILLVPGLAAPIGSEGLNRGFEERARQVAVSFAEWQDASNPLEWMAARAARQATMDYAVQAAPVPVVWNPPAAQQEALLKLLEAVVTLQEGALLPGREEPPTWLSQSPPASLLSMATLLFKAQARSEKRWQTESSAWCADWMEAIWREGRAYDSPADREESLEWSSLALLARFALAPEIRIRAEITLEYLLAARLVETPLVLAGENSSRTFPASVAWLLFGVGDPQATHENLLLAVAGYRPPNLLTSFVLDQDRHFSQRARLRKQATGSSNIHIVRHTDSTPDTFLQRLTLPQPTSLPSPLVFFQENGLETPPDFPRLSLAQPARSLVHGDSILFLVRTAGEENDLLLDFPLGATIQSDSGWWFGRTRHMGWGLYLLPAGQVTMDGTHKRFLPSDGTELTGGILVSFRWDRNESWEEFQRLLAGRAIHFREKPSPLLAFRDLEGTILQLPWEGPAWVGGKRQVTADFPAESGNILSMDTERFTLTLAHGSIRRILDYFSLSIQLETSNPFAP